MLTSNSMKNGLISYCTQYHWCAESIPLFDWLYQ